MIQDIDSVFREYAPRYGGLRDMICFKIDSLLRLFGASELRSFEPFLSAERGAFSAPKFANLAWGGAFCGARTDWRRGLGPV